MGRIKIFLAGWFLSACISLSAQDVGPQKYADQISADDLKEYLSILASDAMEGREAGKRGQKMAAAFIRAHFEDLGLTGPIGGNYYQTIDLYTTVPGETYVASGANRFSNFADVIYYSGTDTDGEISIPLVFIGNGTEAELDQVDVKNKGVFLLAQTEWIGGNKAVALARERGAKIVFVCNTETKESFDKQASQIRKMNDDHALSLSKPVPSTFTRPGLFIVSPLVVDKLFGVSLDILKKAALEDPKKKAIKKFKPVKISYKASTEIKVVKSENVLGLLEGTDKKDELVIITSHFDHIGVDEGGEGDIVNNGADDDGSGTVAVMEMAKVFADAKKNGQGPRRSILFMAFTAEESGLLGSDFYSRHPVFPLQNTVVNLNIDMIGRRDYKHADSLPYIYVIGADKISSALNSVSESVNKKYSNLIFDYTYNDMNHPDRLYYRSDHWNFAKKNIPIIFYFDGIHEDYHEPGDEVEKIEFDLLTKRAQCIFYTAWEIANRDERIMPDKK